MILNQGVRTGATPVSGKIHVHDRCPSLKRHASGDVPVTNPAPRLCMFETRAMKMDRLWAHNGETIGEVNLRVASALETLDRYTCPRTSGGGRGSSSAAVAGVIYTLLAAVTVFLFEQRSVEPDAQESASWIQDGGNRSRMALALALTSIAAVAFLWFVGLVCRRVGERGGPLLSDRVHRLGIGLRYVVVGRSGNHGCTRAGATGDGSVSVDVFRLVEGLGDGIHKVAAPRIQGLRGQHVDDLRAYQPRRVGYIGYAIALVMFVWPIVATPVGVALPIFVSVSVSSSWPEPGCG